MFKVWVRFPSSHQLVEILARTTGKSTPEVSQVADARKVVQMGTMARQCPVASHVSDYVARLVVATHPDHPSATPMVKQFVRYGASPRGAQAIILGAKVVAIMSGRYNVAFEDIEIVAPAALRHRMILNFEGQAEGISPDDIVTELFTTVPKQIDERKDREKAAA